MLASPRQTSMKMQPKRRKYQKGKRKKKKKRKKSIIQIAIYSQPVTLPNQPAISSSYELTNQKKKKFETEKNGRTVHPGEKSHYILPQSKQKGKKRPLLKRQREGEGEKVIISYITLIEDPEDSNLRLFQQRKEKGKKMLLK